VVVLLQKKQVDLCRSPAQGRLLQKNGKGPRLLEIGRQEDVGEPLGLAQIVLEIGAKPRPVPFEDRRDFAPIDVRPAGSLLRGYPEVDRGLLEPVRGKLPHGDIVQLHEQVGVDDRPSRQVAAREIDPPFGCLQPAVPERCRPAVTAPCAGNSKPAAALPEIVEVESEQIVPLDRIRIEFLQRLVEIGQEPPFGGVRRGLDHQKPAFAPAAKADRDHAVFGAGGVGKAAVRR